MREYPGGMADQQVPHGFYACGTVACDAMSYANGSNS